MASSGGGGTMFQRILVGLDGSPLGRQAFQAALELAERWVQDVMVRHVSAVTPQTSLAEVVWLLLRRGVKAVPVVDARGRLTGMITEGDLLRRADLGLRLSIQQEMPAEAVAQALQRF